MELLIIISVSLLVTTFLVLILNSGHKTKAKKDTLYNSNSTNSYTKVGDIFQILEEANVQINFLGDSDEQ